MMSIRELVELILEFNGWDFRQTAEDIDDLYRQLKLAPSQLLGEFEDMCFEERKCPRCGCDLECEVHKEDRGEFQGFECKEIIYERYCPKCDYGDDE